MTQRVVSTVKPDKKLRLWTAIDGGINLWTPVRNRWAELAWVLVGKFAMVGANAAVMLFLAKWLELETYGLLVITISGQLLLSRLVMMGVDTGMVRLTGIPELKSRSQEVVTAGLVLMAGTCSVLLVVLLLATPLLLYSFGITGWVLAIIVAGVIGTSLVDYGYSFNLGRQEYSLAAVAQGGTAIGRLGLTALAAVVLPVYPVAVFVAYHGASLLSGMAQTLRIARGNWQLPDRALMRQLLRYSFWTGMSNVVIIFTLYQGTFLLMVLKQPETTGIFGLGLTLSLGFFAIYTAYAEYLLVRVRSVEKVKALPRFLTRAMAGALILILACVPVVSAVAMLMPWLLGPEWRDAVPIFVYLAASMVLLIFQAPMVAVCHYLLRPQLITFGWVMRGVLIGATGLILAPQMGATGAAIAQLIGSVLALIVIGSLVAGSVRSATAVDD